MPIVAPEVLLTGAHSMRRCRDVTAAALMVVFAELQNAQVRLDTLVLEPNMALPGDDSGEVATPERVAAETMAALRDVVPEDLAGVAFLSGGQDPGTATMNLAALADLDAPWPITFSFGRALVEPALSAARRPAPHRPRPAGARRSVVPTPPPWRRAAGRFWPGAEPQAPPRRRRGAATASHAGGGAAHWPGVEPFIRPAERFIPSGEH